MRLILESKFGDDISGNAVDYCKILKEMAEAYIGPPKTLKMKSFATINKGF